MRRFSRALLYGVIVAVLGVVLSLLPGLIALEEAVGLKILFKLRGPMPPPPYAVVISLGRESARKLGLPIDSRKWPRSTHAQLVETLHQMQAKVIVFDMLFNEPQSDKEDETFSRSIDMAGNVVLCELLEKESFTIDQTKDKSIERINIERVIPPVSPLAESAVALAPFPLPKIPVQLSRYWTFKGSAEHLPTLPVVAINVITLDNYDDLAKLIKKQVPKKFIQLLPDKNTILENKELVNNVIVLRTLFKNYPSISNELIKSVNTSVRLSNNPKIKQALFTLIRLFGGEQTPFLNYYGPPGTIVTIPYHRILHPSKESFPDEHGIDIRGKAVFIGMSETLNTGQKDGFHTVFSRSDGIDLSGVEIAATAFSNLLEGNAIKPVGFLRSHITLFAWGITIGILCICLRVIPAAFWITLLCTVYLGGSIVLFKYSQLWFPVVVPLFFQAPMAFICIVIWKLFNARKAFEYYLPTDAVDQLILDSSNIDTNARVSYGTCLFTDAQQYTTVAEKFAPEDLPRFMNRYYQMIFEQVKRYGGEVSDIKGDAMLAYWKADEHDIEYRKRACFAALEISKIVNKYKQWSGTALLPTRLGLHAGEFWLGNIGAFKRYEYRPVGDTVNTASRLEKLNRHLNTRILVSFEVIKDLTEFLVRKIGNFKLAGKSDPVAVYELLGTRKEADSHLENLCSHFSAGLDAYADMCFDDAFKLFCETSKRYSYDGPSCFYMQLCEKFSKNPPEEVWNGLILMEEK